MAHTHGTYKVMIGAHVNPELFGPDESLTPAVTVNILPDNVFREIFAFCLSEKLYNYRFHTEEWQRLVQVCQRWQQIIYGSPQYLDLHLYCSNSAVPFNFRKNLSRWPEFPLCLCYSIFLNEDEDVDDLIAALEHPNRVHHLNLFIGSWDSRVCEVLEKMQVSFPVLTDLELEGPDTNPIDEIYDISNNFLGNAAPCLQHLRLGEISFQDLPELLLSARGLVSLQIDDIPADGYILPEAMVEGLTGLTSLRTLCIEFRSLDGLSDSNEGLEEKRRLYPPRRPVLPALTEFMFSGESKYLEDLVARIDMPNVEDIKIDYFRVPPWFDVPQLSQFIGRRTNLGLAQFRRARVTFDYMHSKIQLDRPQGERHQLRFSLGAEISVSDTLGSGLDVIVPRMTRVIGHLTALLSNVGHLSLNTHTYWPEEMNRLDDSNLLPLLHLFPAVEELRVSLTLVAPIVTVLENIAEDRITEVMPALRSLQLGDGNHDPVEPPERFLSFRHLSGHPVAIVNFNTQDQVGASEE